MTRRLDPQVAALLGDALTGRRLSQRTAHDLAETLRRVARANPSPNSGPDRALARDLLRAAEVLEVQADARRRR